MMEKKPSRHQDPLWIYGVNPAREFLFAHGGLVREVLHSREDARVREIVDAARENGIPVHWVDKRALSQTLGHGNHQGIALRVSHFPYADLENLLIETEAAARPWLLLDCIQDPQNLGAILRSACFLGISHVVLPKDRSALITPAAFKAAAGAPAHLTIALVTNLARAMDRLKEAGLWLVGLDLEGQVSLFDVDLSVPVGLVVGNEHSGLRALVKKKCDILAKIPAMGPVQSLNAAAAASIALAEAVRQRLKASRD
ncbi:23S rRNA (guanosine2251-2'-O)-methyltransferase [Desulfacinum infernum DSM 9756]|jgi:23S rRNA (guanosine2251-2'-O)-methyltransferase|uniref:23S rRNA (Guanosine2251-2'-O)-methyltransferase n=1 Tax=Desulfacinum infernum DSM 9756 TaxID=1121391 RepID=A0A1M5BXY6_9BACT|nr:23S rRNA (guanosine(2251)-2'-O)-methyltransferase RlmB [Desulfacinum infernum]SHF47295.1 23S rRNA (guanosine2251-2'-O)-methyltransferase [Desulfacinum infernum DSM 9756]